MNTPDPLTSLGHDIALTSGFTGHPVRITANRGPKTWLQDTAGYLPKVFATPQYQAGRTVVIVTFDGGSAKRTDVPFIVASPYTPVGYPTNVRMDHYATLRGMEQMLGLGLLGHAADAGTPSIRDFFGLK